MANSGPIAYEVQAKTFVYSKGSRFFRFYDKSAQKSRKKASGDYIVHIGGYGDPAPFELWKYNAENGSFDQTLSFRKLDDWHSYPYAYEITSLL